MFVTFDPITRNVTSTAAVSNEAEWKAWAAEQGIHYFEVEAFDHMLFDVWIDENCDVQPKAHFAVAGLPQIRADGVDTFTYAGLPASTRVSINGGDPVGLADGTLELTADTAGYYRIRLEAVGYYTREFTVEAVAV
jgi:hypothetical protein